LAHFYFQIWQKKSTLQIRLLFSVIQYNVVKHYAENWRGDLFNIINHFVQIVPENINLINILDLRT